MVKRILSRSFVYVFLSVAAFLSVFPLYWMFISATNTNLDIIRGTLLPGAHIIENFKGLIDAPNTQLGMAYWNSTRNAVILTFLNVLICSMAGYGFEVFHSKAKDRLMAILLLSMMVPFAATMIPLFQMMADMKFLNSMIGFALPFISTPFLIMLFRQSARSFPYELVEAARVDGVSEVGIFFKMFVPTMKAPYAAAIVISFMAAWNSFLWPRLIMMRTESFTMPIIIQNLQEGYVTDNGVITLAVLITSLPTIIIFFILQRYFAEGLMGTVK